MVVVVGAGVVVGTEGSVVDTVPPGVEDAAVELAVVDSFFLSQAQRRGASIATQRIRDKTVFLTFIDASSRSQDGVKIKLGTLL